MYIHLRDSTIYYIIYWREGGGELGGRVVHLNYNLIGSIVVNYCNIHI